MATEVGTPQKNTIGLAIIATVVDQAGVVINVASATVMNIILTDPNKVKTTHTAVLSTDGTDGKIQYVTIDGDLSIAGLWQGQGYVEVGTFKGYTEKSSFRVIDNL